jgi:hypothetical protein
VHAVNYPKHAAGRSHGFKLVWTDYEHRKGKGLPPPVRGARQLFIFVTVLLFVFSFALMQMIIT